MSVFSASLCVILAATGQAALKAVPGKLYRSILSNQLASDPDGVGFLKIFKNGDDYRVLRFKNPGDGPVLAGFYVYGKEGVFYKSPTTPGVAFNKDGSMVVGGTKYECVDVIIPPLSHFNEPAELVVPLKENQASPSH